MIVQIYHLVPYVPAQCNGALLGTVHEFGTPEYDEFIPPEKRKAGSRAAIVIEVHKVATVSTRFISAGRMRTLSLIPKRHALPPRLCALLYLFGALPLFARSRVVSPSHCTNSNRIAPRSNDGAIPWKSSIISLRPPLPKQPRPTAQTAPTRKVSKPGG